MAEEIVTTPAEQTNSQQQGGDWEARYKGLVLKVQELTLTNRDLTTQLATMSSTIEQQKAQLGMKDTEKGVAIGERDRQLQEALQSKTALEGQVNELRALQLKLKVMKELNAPHLLKILDRIPNMTDEEALKTVMGDFNSFAADLVREREQQLLSGITPPLGGGGSSKKALPTDSKGWEKLLNSLTPGTAEYNQAMDDYQGAAFKSQ